MLLEKTVAVVVILALWALVVWLLTRAPLPPNSPVFATGRYAVATEPQPVQAERPAQAGRSDTPRWPSGALVVIGARCPWCESSHTRVMESGAKTICSTCGGKF